jgi:type I restriction enzyme S subunit
MNATQLLAHFDRLAEAPNAVPRLRRFILDLAVRGKLVEQDAGDEPGLKLLHRIQIEKARPLKKGVTRKTADAAEVSEDSQLFVIPRSWVWTNLAGIADFSAGRTPSRHETVFWNSGDYPWVSIRDMRAGETLFNTSETVSETARLKVFGSEPVPAGTLIMSFKLTIGRISRLGIPAFHNEAIISIRPHLQLLDPYLFKVLPLFAQSGNSKDAIKGATLNRESLSNIPIALPPLAEQHRIVAKVDELMALCDQLEAAQQKREHHRDRLAAASLQRLNQPAADTTPESQREHARFHLHHLPSLTTRPEHIKAMRQAIFNLAVRGRLVSQVLSDEPAATVLSRITQARDLLYVKRQIPKPRELPKIKDLSIPFGIPEGWSWTMLGNLCYQVSDGPHFSPRYVSPAEGVPFLSARHVRLGGFDLADMKYVSRDDHEEFCRRIRPEKGDILYTKGGTTGIARVNDLDFEFSVWVHLAVLRVAKDFVAPRYIELALNSPLCYEQSQAYTQGISNFDLGLTRMIKIVMPLPPLAEQYRIVTKVDELMALCDQLEAQLTTTQTDSRRLLEAVLEAALVPV